LGAIKCSNGGISYCHSEFLLMCMWSCADKFGNIGGICAFNNNDISEFKNANAIYETLQ
jgi:hypothetical protein